MLSEVINPQVGDIVRFDDYPQALWVIVERAENSSSSWASVNIDSGLRRWVFGSRYYTLCENEPNTINHRWRFLNDPLPAALSP
jgi:hypothetical protein